LLLIEDDARLRSALAGALTGECEELRTCADARSAFAVLRRWHPEVVLLDVSLPDGTAFDVLEVLARRAPMPAVIAMSGVATAVDTFRLSQMGVRAYLAKPFGLAELEAAFARIQLQPPDLRPHLRGTVGQRSVQEVEREVRAVMVSEALARTGGSRRGAARLLSISRQLLQYMLRGRPAP
jgi:DNA-binding NtrC family response regulator